VTSAAAVLVVPLALLLCAQWPLRDWLHAYSRKANDLVQLVFGIYVSVGITAATRAHFHLTPDVVARRYPARVRRWIGQAVSIGIVAPFAGAAGGFSAATIRLCGGDGGQPDGARRSSVRWRAPCCLIFWWRRW
jgi:TRAP-type C4-dicarboxylate transport system permease small subunit